MSVSRLIWDIESSPNVGYFWRPGWKIQLGHDNILHERQVICICYKFEGQKKVHSLKWDYDAPNGERDKAMIAQFVEVAAVADELVAHNGDRFDLPWIKGRCIKHGIDMNPLVKTVDTLAWSRKMGFNSNRLDYLGRYLFGDGKDKTEFGMWKDIMEHNCPTAMARMVRYCKKDVVLLEKVYKELARFNQPKTHAGVQAGGEKWHCAHCSSDNVIKSKTTWTAAGTVKHQMQCKDCGRYSTISDTAHSKYLEYKKEKADCSTERK